MDELNKQVEARHYSQVWPVNGVSLCLVVVLLAIYVALANWRQWHGIIGEDVKVRDLQGRIPDIEILWFLVWALLLMLRSVMGQRTVTKWVLCIVLFAPGLLGVLGVLANWDLLGKAVERTPNNNEIPSLHRVLVPFGMGVVTSFVLGVIHVCVTLGDRASWMYKNSVPTKTEPKGNDLEP